MSDVKSIISTTKALLELEREEELEQERLYKARFTTKVKSQYFIRRKDPFLCLYYSI